MTVAAAVAVLVLAASSAVSGAFLVRTPARATGAALLLFAAAATAATLLWSARPGPALALFLAAWTLGFTPAVLAYPSVRWREPVPFVVWVCVLAGAGPIIAGGGGEATLLPMALLIATALIANHLWRYDAVAADRVPLLWSGLAVVGTTLVYGQSAFILEQGPSRVLGLVVVALVPPVLVVGVRRPTIVDVRGLVVECLVVLVAVFAYIAVFVGVDSVAALAGADRLPTGTLALIAAITAAGFHPLRVGLRGVIDELLFGNRPDPLEAATRVADQIGDDPVLALTAVREAMVLPYASLQVDGVELASSGTPVPHTRRLSLALGGDRLGEVVVGLRSGDLHLSAADERVLRIVAPLLAQTLRARSLASDLRTSRGQAIIAIEEERRRIRRDLHDGLGPTLSGIAFTADAARNSLGDPGAADTMLRTLRAEAAAAIAEVRRLVYGMRPPALDELGLVGALRQWVVQLRTAEGRPLAVSIEADADVDLLPAAVEVAAYRIAVEALTNAARHSGSDRAELRMTRDGDALTVVVQDHGTDRTHWQPGVGTASMHERAAEVGGTVTAQPTPAGGLVVATLPVP